jgi:N,N'-diacetyllegionaminate synthase
VSLEIRGRRIGRQQTLFVIAEIGLNHGGSVDRALQLVDAAARAGAAAVKVQTIDADRLVAADCPAPAHVDVPSLADFFRTFELDFDAHVAIADRAHALGLAFMATPFSLEAVDLLERAGVDAYKIASGDVTFHALVERCARTGKPLVLSTGLASLSEVAAAVGAARRAGVRGMALLHCVSAYPVPAGAENLAAIATLASAFDMPAGLSDHAPSTSSVPVAVALGASIYERHFVLDRGDDCIDAAVSSDAADLAAVVTAAADTLAVLGDGVKRCQPAEAPNLVPSRRALHATRALRAGHIVAAGDIAVVRPATGLAPDACSQLIGVRLQRDVAAGAPFVASDLVQNGCSCAHA